MTIKNDSKFEKELTCHAAQKMKFSIKDFFSKCANLQFPADLFTCTKEILNGKIHFCAVSVQN